MDDLQPNDVTGLADELHLIFRMLQTLRQAFPTLIGWLYQLQMLTQYYYPFTTGRNIIDNLITDFEELHQRLKQTCERWQTFVQRNPQLQTLAHCPGTDDESLPGYIALGEGLLYDGRQYFIDPSHGIPEGDPRRRTVRADDYHLDYQA